MVIERSDSRVCVRANERASERDEAYLEKIVRRTSGRHWLQIPRVDGNVRFVRVEEARRRDTRRGVSRRREVDTRFHVGNRAGHI